MKPYTTDMQFFFDFDNKSKFSVGEAIVFIDPVFKKIENGFIKEIDGNRIKVEKQNDSSIRRFTISESDILEQPETDSPKAPETIEMAAVDKNISQTSDKTQVHTPELPIITEVNQKIVFTNYRPHGAWENENNRLSSKERIQTNQKCIDLLKKNRELLTNTDFDTLRRYSGWGGTNSDERGVLYDFYTSPPIAHFVWHLLNKIEPLQLNETVLEPSCGTGVFFETAPDEVRLTGVELDNRTGSIASILYPQADVFIGSFEQYNLTLHPIFDRVIGNVPFGDRSVLTSFLDMSEEKNLDRYFISRSIDNVKSGGTLALITHPGVMNNSSNRIWRESIQKKAQFVGAIRLPNTSFRHTQTQVQPDILFFRKLPQDISLRLTQLSEEAFKDSVFYNDQWIDGTYFLANTKHIAGSLSIGTGQWGSDEVKGTVSEHMLNETIDSFSPIPSYDAKAFMEIRNLFPNIILPDEQQTLLYLSKEEAEQTAKKELQPGDTKSVDSILYKLTGEFRWQVVSADTEIAEKIEQIRAISTDIQAIRTQMQLGNTVDELQVQARKHIEQYKHRYFTYPNEDMQIKTYLNKNPALKSVYEGIISIDAAILNDKNIYEQSHEAIDGHNPAIEALTKLQSLMKEGTEENIKQYFPSESQILLQLMMENEDIFLSAQMVFQLREDFISGNAWETIDALNLKLLTAPEDITKKLTYGITELEKAIGWVNIEEVSISPHSSWIPENIINDWAVDENGADYSYVFFNKQLGKNQEGKWGLFFEHETRKPDQNYYTPAEYYQPGVWYEYAHELVYYLNLQKQRSSRNDTETFNQTLNENFKSWISSNEEKRTIIENLYNRLFNTEIGVPTKIYPVYLEGWQETKTLKPHQWQTIHHLYKAQCGISALGTGFGKTLSAVGLITLLYQEKKINRAWVQVPNNKVKDWVNEIQSVMPSFRIGFVDTEAKGYTNRQTRYLLYQQLANNLYDILVMPESAASEIQLQIDHDKEITEQFVSKHLADKKTGDKKLTKRAEQQIKDSAETKLSNGKTNTTISFEDFGCDAMFVDEAHRYKNLFTSSLSRETGMNDGRASEKALSLFKKTSYIRKTHENNIYFFTATPLTNSPLEYYNMMMYIAPEELEKRSIFTIDSFIKNFADIRNGFKYDWATSKIIEGKILTGFKEIKTLQDLFFKYTDLQNDPNKINLQKPKANNYPNIIAANPTQISVIKSISEELEKFRTTPKENRNDLFPGENFLTFYSQMRTASLDIELYDPQTYKNWENPKLEQLSKNARSIFLATGGGQVIFCDRVFSSDSSLNIHDKIKASLEKHGFRSSEIVIVNGFTKTGGIQGQTVIEKTVSTAVTDYNSGKYKIIIGTTACIGEGLNLQENSSALHHFDIPFRPSDFIQRNGRIDRQGNNQGIVELHTYLSNGTIDNYSVSLVQNKANWIDTLLKTKSNVFTNPNDENFIDPDELLLALSEEWGDTEKNTERRAEIERMKVEKITEAQNIKRIEGMTALSLMRNSLAVFSGDKGSAQYQTRMRKILNLEKTLQANPTFHNKELIDSVEPFLFNRNKELIIRINDAFVLNNRKYLVKELNHIKQTISAESVYTTQSRISSGNQLSKITVNDLQNVSSYFSRPTEQELKHFHTLGTEDFYTFADATWQENNYITHLQMGYHNSLDTSPVFFTVENEKVKLNTFYYNSNASKKNICNIYNEHERNNLVADIQKNGLVIEKYFLDQYSVLLEKNHPDIFEKVKNHITIESEDTLEENPALYGTSYDLTGFTAEETAIALQAIQKNTFLKTPNGEVTQLTPKQWAYARTEGFKNQYGDWEDAYKSFVSGLEISGKSYTAKSVIRVDQNNNHYYDHRLSQNEKGHLLDNLSPQHDGREISIKPLTNNMSEIEKNQGDYFDIYNKRLLQILQTNLSVTLDKNFEPLQNFFAAELSEFQSPYTTKQQFLESKYAAKAISGKILTQRKTEEQPGLWKSFRNFKNRGVFDIIGEKIAIDPQGHISQNGYNQLAAALHIYRNKKFETVRYLFINKEGILQDQIAISSRLPARTAVSPRYGSEKQEQFFSSCYEYAKTTNTRIVVVHNHPSGNIAPSFQDMDFTNTVKQRFSPFFEGHIILDHGTFGLYKPQHDTWTAITHSPAGNDPLLKKRNKFADIVLQNERDLKKAEEIVCSIDSKSHWNEKQWVPIFFAGAGLRINAVKYVSKNNLLNLSEPQLRKNLLSTAKATGAPYLFPVINDCDPILAEKLSDYFKKGSFFTDMLINGKNFFYEGTRRPVDLFSDSKPTPVIHTTIKDFRRPYNPITGRIYPDEIKKSAAAEQADYRFLTFHQINTCKFTLSNKASANLLTTLHHPNNKNILKHTFLVNAKDITGLSLPQTQANMTIGKNTIEHTNSATKKENGFEL